MQSVETVLQRALQDTTKKSMHGVPKPDTLFKDALDKSLPQMSTMLSEALRQPIQQSFVQYFQDKLIPSFDQSCKVMFNQLNSTFEHGIQDVLTAQKAYTPSSATSNTTTDSNVLAEQLRVTVQTLLDVTSSMSSNIVETQNKLLASHQAPPSSQSHYQPPIQPVGQSHQPLHSTPPPATLPMHVAPYQNPQPVPSHLPVPPPDAATSNMHATLLRLISQRRFNEAFDMVLSASNLPLVAWLCRMIGDPQVMFFGTPMSQPVLVSLVQQLAYDLDSETALKFKWLQEVIPHVDVRGMSNEPGQVRDIMLHLHAKLEENYAKYVNVSAHSVPFKLLYQIVCKQISTQ